MLISPRTAVVVIVAAIALMASAGAGATAALMITGKQIKDNSVTSQDIKNKSLKVKDLSTKAQAKLKGRTGATGATGARGPAGPAGPAGTSGLPGLPGLSGFELKPGSLPIPGGLAAVTSPLSVSCTGGKKALAATASFTSPVANLLTQVTRTSETTFQAVGIPVLGSLLGPNTLNLDVVCANVPS